MLKRPIRIYEDGGQLYIKNNKGKKVYIKTTLTKSKVQKQFIKQYEKNKHTKPNRKRKRIATRVYTKVPVVLRPATSGVNRTGDTKSASTIATLPVVAESKQPPPSSGSKDSIYMSTGERDDALIKQITYNRVQNLIKSGIDPSANTASEIKSDSKSLDSIDRKMKDIELQQKGLAEYVRETAVQIEDRLSKPTGSTDIKQRQNKERLIKGISSSPAKQSTYRAATARQKKAMKKEFKQLSVDDTSDDAEDMSASGLSTATTSTYPDESLYEDQIVEIIKKHDGVFCPVIAHDEIDKIILNPNGKPTFFIMNLSNRNSPSGGTHWTGVWIDKKDCCYFDSFGREPDAQTKRELKTLLGKNDLNTLRKFKYNTKDIQDINSSDCGYMSIKFIENMLHGKSFKESTNYTEADVQKMVKKYTTEYL